MTKCVLFINGNYLPMPLEDSFVDEFEKQLKDAMSSGDKFWWYQAEAKGKPATRYMIKLEKLDGYYFQREEPGENLLKRQVEVAEKMADILGQEPEGDEWKKE